MCFGKLPVVNLTSEPSHFGGYEWFLVENALTEYGIWNIFVSMPFRLPLYLNDVGVPFSVTFFYQQSTVVRLSKLQKYLLMSFSNIFLLWVKDHSLIFLEQRHETGIENNIPNTQSFKPSHFCVNHTTRLRLKDKKKLTLSNQIQRQQAPD